MKIFAPLFKLTILIAFVLLGLIFYPAQGKGAGQTKDQLIRGEKTYLTYCASCHGVDGSGKGPVASSLKNTPPDLRRFRLIAGKFPEEEIQRKISGENSLPVHGKKDMPVWGLILRRGEIINLVKYLESIQRPFDPQPAG
jgi:mono/diheme cytochrome c family protein